MRPVTRQLGTGLAAILLLPLLAGAAGAANTVDFPLSFGPPTYRYGTASHAWYT